MKNATLYIIVCLATLAGCTKQVEPIALSRENIVLNVGQETFINTLSVGDYQWRSSNDFAIEVLPSGLVRAKFEGTGEIVVSAADGRSASCKVVSLATLHNFTEPILLPGAHPRKITQAEQRQTTLESPTLLIYKDPNPKVERLYYLFGGGGLNAAGIEFRRAEMSIEELENFMAQRYQHTGLRDGQRLYRGSNLSVAIQESATLWIVRYFLNSSTSSAPMLSTPDLPWPQ